jgi:multiple sugar transport system ATP-binding protein
VAVIKKGVLQQIAPPQELYDRPINLFVAGFIGSPAMNFLAATLHKSAAGDYSLEIGKETIAIPAATLVSRPALANYVDKPLIVGIRPEDIDDAAAGAANQTIHALAELIEPLGSDLMVHVSFDVPPVDSHPDVAELKKDVGDEEAPIATTEGRTSGVARLNPRSAVREGSEIALSIDTDRLHYFDAVSGEAVWTD